MDEHEWLCCVRTARRKRRLVITDRDKRLIQLDKRKCELLRLRRQLPPVPLDTPYQRGWKRFFVLHDDVKYSDQAAFYETLLGKINTTEYHPEKSFKPKRSTKRHPVHHKEQQLKVLHAPQWETNTHGLTDLEKSFFSRSVTYVKKEGYWDIKYAFTEPWRYTFKVAPNIITHKNPVDRELEKELAWIQNQIERNHLEPRIYSLTCGKRWHKRFRPEEEKKYINAIKRIPTRSSIEAYLEF